MRNILSILAIIISIGSYIIISNIDIPLGADNSKFVGGHTYRLSAPISSSASSVKLSSFTIKQTGLKITMTNFGTVGYGTIEPGSTDRQEFITWTGITQNADNTATLTGVSRGIEPISPYTASSTYQFSHAGGSTFIVSDSPSLFNDAVFKANDESITGIYNFASTSPPRYDLVPANHNTGSVVATTSEFASIAYVDQTTVAGCGDASEAVQGCVELATQIEMASSSENGAEAKLVLQAKYATSSPDVRGLYAIISTNAGFLKQAWLNLTEQFTFTLLLATQATSTNQHFVNQPTIGTDFNNIAIAASSTTFTSSGIYIKTSNVTKIYVQVWGAGGGGGTATDSGTDSGGGGGGGGSYIEKWFNESELGANETITIGSGGAAATVGGNTTFGSLLTAYGGGAGGSITNGDGGGGGGAGILSIGSDASGATQGSGGSPLGGSSAGVDSSFGGGSGNTAEGGGGDTGWGGGGGSGADSDGSGSGATNSGNSYAGGGGGGGGTGDAGGGSNDGSPGTSILGGDGGAGGDNSVGLVGVQPGGGGGGGQADSGTQVGGVGGDGQIIITEYF